MFDLSVAVAPNHPLISSSQPQVSLTSPSETTSQSLSIAARNMEELCKIDIEAEVCTGRGSSKRAQLSGSVVSPATLRVSPRVIEPFFQRKKLGKLYGWRINPSNIHFLDNVSRGEGGFATVLRATRLSAERSRDDSGNERIVQSQVRRCDGLVNRNQYCDVYRI